MTRILVAVLLVTASLLGTTGEPALVMPNRGDSVKFAVLGR